MDKQSTNAPYKTGSIGILVSNMTAKIVDEEGRGKLLWLNDHKDMPYWLYKNNEQIEVATGERGELWLKGPNIMKVYKHMLL